MSHRVACCISPEEMTGVTTCPSISQRCWFTSGAFAGPKDSILRTVIDVACAHAQGSEPIVSRR